MNSNSSFIVYLRTTYFTFIFYRLENIISYIKVDYLIQIFHVCFKLVTNQFLFCFSFIIIVIIEIEIHQCEFQNAIYLIIYLK